MLAADKLQLQSSLKQQATALKEKEFNLHHSNLMTVGTQAAVLASLDMTMFIEFTPPHDNEWGNALVIPRLLKSIYYISITSAFCANILVVGQTTQLSLLGSSLALRGPDGSMITATDGLYEERKRVFAAFGFGLGATMTSIVILVWIMFSPETAVVCMTVAITTAFFMYSDYCRIQKRFDYDENETVDFTDIFEGPAAIRAMPSYSRKKQNRRGRSERKKYLMYMESSSSDSMSETENGMMQKVQIKRSESSPHLSHDTLDYDDDFDRVSLSNSERIHGMIGRTRRSSKSSSPGRKRRNKMPII